MKSTILKTIKKLLYNNRHHATPHPRSYTYQSRRCRLLRFSIIFPLFLILMMMSSIASYFVVVSDLCAWDFPKKKRKYNKKCCFCFFFIWAHFLKFIFILNHEKNYRRKQKIIGKISNWYRDVFFWIFRWMKILQTSLSLFNKVVRLHDANPIQSFSNHFSLIFRYFLETYLFLKQYIPLFKDFTFIFFILGIYLRMLRVVNLPLRLRRYRHLLGNFRFSLSLSLRTKLHKRVAISITTTKKVHGRYIYILF